MGPLAMQLLREKSRSTLIYFLFAILIIVFVFTFNTSGGSGGCSPVGPAGTPIVQVGEEDITFGIIGMGAALSGSGDNPSTDRFVFASIIPLRESLTNTYPDEDTAAISTRINRLYSRAASLPLGSPELADPDLDKAPGIKYIKFVRPVEQGDTINSLKVLNDLVETWLVAKEAKSMGLRVGADELKRRSLSEQRRKQFAPSEPDYNAFLENELLREKVIELLASQATVTDQEVEQLYMDESEKVSVEYIAVDPAKILPLVPVTDAELATSRKDTKGIAAYYKAHQPEYLTKKVSLRGIFVKAPSKAGIAKEKDAAKKAKHTKSRSDARAKASAILANLQKASASITTPPKPGGTSQPKPPATKPDTKKAKEAKPPVAKTDTKTAGEAKPPAAKTDTKKAEEAKPSAEKTDTKKPEEAKPPAEKTDTKKPEEAKPPAEKTDTKEPEEAKPPAEKTDTKEPEEAKPPTEKTDSKAEKKPDPQEAFRKAFIEQVKKNSDDADSKGKDGLFQPMTSYELEDRFKAAAISTAAIGLKVGQLTGVLEVDNGFWIFTADEVGDGVDRLLADVTEEIAKILAQTKKAPEFAKAVAAEVEAAARKEPGANLSEIARQWNIKHAPEDAKPATKSGGPLQPAPPKAEAKQAGDKKDSKEATSPKKPAADAPKTGNKKPADKPEAKTTATPPTDTKADDKPEAKTPPATATDKKPGDKKPQPAAATEKPKAAEEGSDSAPKDEAPPPLPLTFPGSLSATDASVDAGVRIGSIRMVIKLKVDLRNLQTWEYPQEGAAEAVNPATGTTAADSFDDYWAELWPISGRAEPLRNAAVKGEIFRLSKKNRFPKNVFLDKETNIHFVIRYKERQETEDEEKEKTLALMRRMLLTQRQVETYASWYRVLLAKAKKDGNVKRTETGVTWINSEIKAYNQREKRNRGRQPRR
jgi:hypothetical protein